MFQAKAAGRTPEDCHRTGDEIGVSLKVNWFRICWHRVLEPFFGPLTDLCLTILLESELVY